MACSLQVRRNFLLSIIRSPTLSRPVLPLRVCAQSRALHLTHPLRDNVPSITFGSQIDSLLGVGKKSHSSKKTLKPKSKRRLPKSTDKLNATEARNRTTAAVEETGAGPNSKDGETIVLSETTDAILQTANTVPQKQGNVDEQVTLELSEDAYEEISTPARRPGRKSEARVIGKPSVRSTTNQRREGSGRARSEQSTMHTSKVDQGSTAAPERPPTRPQKKLEPWRIQKEALITKFGEDGWNPRKKLSPDAIEGIQALHEQDPERYSTAILSQQFKVSPEAIRRMLRSKWRPSPEVMEDRRARWARRHDRIWDQKAALGQRPARKKDRRPEGPEAFEEEVKAKQMLGQL